MGIYKSAKILSNVHLFTYFIRKNNVLCKERRLFSSGSPRQTVQKFVSSKKSTSLKTSQFPFLLIFPITGFGLGTWQVYRRDWKLNLIKEMEEKTTAEPIPLPSNLDELKDLEYTKVLLRGRFDHTKELYVYPRQPLNQQEALGSGLISTASNIGAQVITAFQLSDTKKWVLVNRGWVPRNEIDQKTRLEGQIEGEVELPAIVRKSEKMASIGPRNKPEVNQWIVKDADAMSKVLGTEPVIFDATIESTVPHGPLGGQTNITLRNQHLNYIITWYSLCLITAAFCYKKYWPGRPLR